MSKTLNILVMIAIILNLQILCKGTRVYDSFYTNLRYIGLFIW